VRCGGGGDDDDDDDGSIDRTSPAAPLLLVIVVMTRRIVLLAHSADTHTFGTKYRGNYNAQESSLIFRHPLIVSSVF
jgi:hypothetical protein